MMLLVASVAAQQTPARDTMPSPSGGTAVISGVVVTAVQPPQPMRRVTVSLSGSAPWGSRSMVTDETGRFQFDKLPAGRYLLSAYKPAYLVAQYRTTASGTATADTAIAVAEGQRLTDIALPLVRGGVITGRITDERGQRHSGALAVEVWHLTSDEFWNTQTPQIEPFLGWRRTAAEIAARRPAVSPDELARASAIVAPQIQELAAERANLGAHVPAGGEALRGLIASGFASIPVLVSIVCGLISVLAVPGGLVTRALRHAVVRRDGREIGRARSALRFLVEWSPVLVGIACVGVPMLGEPRVSSDVAVVVGGLAFLVMAAGAA